MRSYKLLILVISFFVFVAGASFGQKTKQKKEPVATLSAMKFLAQGSSGTMEKPFIFVARDKETYAALKKIVEGLPGEPGEVDFSKMAVAAVFLGMKPTGGYDISLSVDVLNDPYIGAKLTVSAVNPPRGALLTEAFTSPFKVALVPVDKNKTLKIEAGAEWKTAAEVYKIVSGNFEARGGVRYLYSKFPVSGTVRVWRSGDMATCAFDLAGKSAGKGSESVALTETASGVVGKDNLLKLSRLDAGSFVRQPRYPLRAEGKLDAEKFSLDLSASTSSSPQIRENSEGHGKLEFTRQK